MQINKPKILMFFIIISAIGLDWQSCDTPWQPGPAPSTIIETEFVPGLNVLGVVRLEDTTANSFVYVERAYAADEYDAWSDTLPIIKNAQVRISGSGDTTSYIFRYYDNLSDHKYINVDFRPVAGESYHLTISAPGLPELTASASVPHLPEIDTNSVQVSADEVSFRLRTTADAYLYDVYLFCENGQLVEKFTNNQISIKEMKFKFGSSLGNPLAIQIFSYDENMASVADATSSIIPQSFLETISTVEGGYGCFGAVSVLTYILP